MHDLDYIKNGEQIDMGIEHYWANNAMARAMHLPEGGRAASHKHEYDHISIVCSLHDGDVVTVITPNGATTHKSGDCITLEAGIEHEIRALQDIKWFCIHATVESDPKKQDEILIETVPKTA